MTMGAHLIFILSSLTSVTASSDVFKMVNSSVQLNITQFDQNFRDLQWMYKTKYILKYINADKKEEPTPAYEGRVEFDKDTYSLTVKNLQKNDNGDYKARLIYDEKEKVIAEYTLFVLDPVVSPVITHIPQHPSRDSCYVTGTCRGHTLSVNFNCSNDVCEHNKTSHSVSTLSVYVSGGTIICNHSNPVSWKKRTIEMKEICLGPTNQLLYTLIALSGCVALTLLLTVIYNVIRLRRKKRDGTNIPLCDTVYAEIENESERPRQGMRLEKDGPATLYSVIGQQLPQSNGSAQVVPNNERNQQEACVDQSLRNTYYTVADKKSHNVPSTIYSTVDRSNPGTIYGVVKKVSKAADGAPSRMRK